MINSTHMGREHVGSVAVFDPSSHYDRNMQNYGVLPKSLNAKRAQVDPYATDQAYWRSFWWRAQRRLSETDAR
jgi:hypothetical protein